MSPSFKTALSIGLATAGAACAGGSNIARVAVRPSTEAQIILEFSEVRPSGMLLELDITSAGELTHEDYIREADDSHLQLWELPVARDQELTVDLTSDDFDAYLWVLGPGFEEDDDDGGGFCNSRITFTPVTDGTYHVYVSTLRGRETGNFELLVSRQPPATDPRDCEMGFALDYGPSGPDTGALRENFLAIPVTSTLHVGETTEGHFSRSSETVAGKYSATWALDLPGGETATIDMVSEDFDTYLWVIEPEDLLRDDDGAGSCNARITLHPEQATHYTVVATSFSTEQRGDYTLVVTEFPGPTVGGACSRSESFGGTVDLIADLAPQPSKLQLGSDVTGTITESDEMTEDEKFVQVWELDGRERQHVTVELTSTDFDTYLWLVGNGLQLSDDDGGGNCNSTINALLPADGIYRVGVTSFSTRATGAYELKIAEEPSDERPGSCGPATFSGTEEIAAFLEALEPPDERRVELGSDVTGTISSDDFITELDQTIQTWQWHVTAGEEATIELISTDFDAYLWVVGSGVSLVDDDGAGNCNSAISISVTANTSYTVGVTSLGGSMVGNFRLRVLESPGSLEDGGCGTGMFSSSDNRQACVDAISGLDTGERFLARERVVRASLDEDDFRCDDGSYLDAWTLFGERGETVTIDLTSEEFDTYLYVAGPGLETTLTSDDDGGACNSRLELEFPMSGNYTVVASSFSQGATGNYGLRITHNPPPPRTGDCPSEAGDATTNSWNESSVASLPIEGRSISADESLDGFLSRYDVEASSGEYRQAWRLEGRPGDFVSIDLESDEFDTFLAVSGSGLGVETDDDGGESTNSRLSVVIPEDGELIIVVSSFSSGTTGEFILSVEKRERK